MVKNPTAIPAEVAAYGGTGRADLGSKRGGPMRRIDTLRTLAIGSALILAIGTTACANEEDTSDTGELPNVELPNVEVSPPADAPEEAADETSPVAESGDEGTSEEEDEETSEEEDEETSEAGAE